MIVQFRNFILAIFCSSYQYPGEKHGPTRVSSVEIYQWSWIHAGQVLDGSEIHHVSE